MVLARHLKCGVVVNRTQAASKWQAWRFLEMILIDTTHESLLNKLQWFLDTSRGNSVMFLDAWRNMIGSNRYPHDRLSMIGLQQPWTRRIDCSRNRYWIYLDISQSIGMLIKARERQTYTKIWDPSNHGNMIKANQLVVIEMTQTKESEDCAAPCA